MNTFEMNDQQVAGLAAAICATAEAMGQEMNPGTAAIMAEDLCAYPAPVVKAALKACRFEVKGKLAMADILQRVQVADGRPGKDEAWAIAMTTNDEFETVVLTDEIQLALVAAKPVLDAGDKLSAATLDELKAEIANDAAFAPLIAGSKASGGGAGGAGGGGGAPKGKIGGTKEERTAAIASRFPDLPQS